MGEKRIPSWILVPAPALLIATALGQLALTHAGPLSPAKGGGFGLFSTVDKLENRILLAFLETPEGDRPISVNGFKLEVDEALAFPVGRNLEQLAAAVGANPPPGTPGTAIRVEVWKRAFDPSTGAVRRVRLGKRSVPLGGSGG